MKQGDQITVGDGPVRFRLGYRDLVSAQGVSISVLAEVGGQDAELLRFDCFDHQPHYHYGPEKKDERLYLDRTTEGDPLEWALLQLAIRLPDMIARAGYAELAESLDLNALQPDLVELGTTARRLARESRATVK